MTAGTPIDWGEIHRRVAEVQERLADQFSPSRMEQEWILRERARALAREPVTQREEYLEVVEFLLAGETYGVEASFVQEVSSLKELVPLPGLPPFILGIVNLRGRILSVVDLRQFFDLPNGPLSELARLLVLASPEMEFALLADEVLGLRQVPTGELQPGVATLSTVGKDYLKGITRAREIILDAAALLKDERMIIRDQ